MNNSNSLKLYFRVLVLLSVALYVGWFFFGLLESRFYGPEITDLMTWSGYGAAFGWNVLTYFAYGSLLAYGMVSVGLVYFKSWARECFLLLTVIVLLMTFAYGINILTEASMVYLQLMNLIDGFIIAIIYFSTLSEEFKFTPGQRIQSDPAEQRR